MGDWQTKKVLIYDDCTESWQDGRQRRMDGCMFYDCVR